MGRPLKRKQEKSPIRFLIHLSVTFLNHDLHTCTTRKATEGPNRAGGP